MPCKSGIVPYLLILCLRSMFCLEKLCHLSKILKMPFHTFWMPINMGITFVPSNMQLMSILCLFFSLESWSCSWCFFLCIVLLISNFLFSFLVRCFPQFIFYPKLSKLYKTSFNVNCIMKCEWLITPTNLVLKAFVHKVLFHSMVLGSSPKIYEPGLLKLHIFNLFLA